jgi:hypothetical protein
MKPAQKSTTSFPGRHDFLFEDLRDELGDSPKILSVGCAAGYEALDLKRLIPHARIFGCEVNQKALGEAMCLCTPHGITIFESNVEAIRKHGPYDAITCLHVLVKYPDVQDKDDISSIYPFAEFDASLGTLVSNLASGGIIVVYNSCYLVEHSSVRNDVQAVPPGRHRQNGWIEKYGRDGRRLSRCFGRLNEEWYPLRTWRRKLKEQWDLFEDQRAIEMLEYRHDLLCADPVDTTTIMWRKTAW